jgi:PPK2 family polyphosphate:nucleotide phosphotransferase
METEPFGNLSTKAPESAVKSEIKRQMPELKKKLAELQNVFYADGQHALLVIFQGVDASGKDGTVRKVFSGVNPAGCHVKSWKVPTEEERQHDFLWRIHKHVPPKGMIHIFNRSHYEDIIVPRVKNLVPVEQLQKRYDSINAFERLLKEESNTIVLKFYLHISKEEQIKRLNERLENPQKRWKYDPGDFVAHSHWDNYMQAYRDVFEQCCEAADWHVVPADQKWYRNFMVIKKVVERLDQLNLAYPEQIKDS